MGSGPSLRAMADIKLTYFAGRGRAEISRLILSYAGVKFTDERVTGEQFGAMKSSLPWGQVPVLAYHGHTLCQSLSIARFLATEFGLAGNTNLERAQANEIVDAVSDLQTAMIKVAFSNDDAGLKNVVENNLTWADLAVFQFVSDGMGGKAPKDVSGFPLIANLCKRVGQIPNIKNWMTVRPVTAL